MWELQTQVVTFCGFSSYVHCFLNDMHPVPLVPYLTHKHIHTYTNTHTTPPVSCIHNTVRVRVSGWWDCEWENSCQQHDSSFIFCWFSHLISAPHLHLIWVSTFTCVYNHTPKATYTNTRDAQCLGLIRSTPEVKGESSVFACLCA